MLCRFSDNWGGLRPPYNVTIYNTILHGHQLFLALGFREGLGQRIEMWWREGREEGGAGGQMGSNRRQVRCEEERGGGGGVRGEGLY